MKRQRKISNLAGQTRTFGDRLAKTRTQLAKIGDHLATVWRPFGNISPTFGDTICTRWLTSRENWRPFGDTFAGSWRPTRTTGENWRKFGDRLATRLAISRQMIVLK